MQSLSFLDICKSLLHIPFGIRWVSISLFLFVMGRGLWWDAFFSVYVKQIMGTGMGLTLIGSLLPLVKLMIVIPIWTLNDQWHSRYLLLLGKILYAFSALGYFAAGLQHSPSWLIVAVVLNGLASSMMYTTYRSLYGKKAQKKNRSQIFGVYFSSINLAYVIGAGISYFLVQYLELPYMYLFVVIFGIFSILQDSKIQDFIRRKFSKTRKRFSKKQVKKANLLYEIDEDSLDLTKMWGKKGTLACLIREFFSLAPWKRMFFALQGYGLPMYVSLASQAMVSFINYVGFLFIPLIAMEHSLGLPEIAILFAVMKVPYLVNILIGNLGDKYNKKILITLLLLVSGVLFIFLWRSTGFLQIVGVSFGLSLIVALLQPITVALMLEYAKPKDKGLMAGMQEFSNRVGEIVGSFGFGVLAARIGMELSFQLLGVAILVLAAYLLSKKLFEYGVFAKRE